jgi:hypothetical protein
MAVVAQVACGPDDPATPCPPGNVCCFHSFFTDSDACALAQDGCGTAKTLRCNFHDDCTGSQLCCGDYDTANDIYETECRESCADETMCNSTADCGAGQECLPFLTGYYNYDNAYLSCQPL